MFRTNCSRHTKPNNRKKNKHLISLNGNKQREAGRYHSAGLLIFFSKREDAWSIYEATFYAFSRHRLTVPATVLTGALPYLFSGASA
jgi:hypothetical protein